MAQHRQRKTVEAKTLREASLTWARGTIASPGQYRRLIAQVLNIDEHDVTDEMLTVFRLGCFEGTRTELMGTTLSGPPLDEFHTEAELKAQKG